MLRMMVLAALIAMPFTPAFGREEDKGKLGELKDKLIAIEVTHRKNSEKIQDAIDVAKEADEKEKVAKLEKDMETERDRYKKEAQDFTKSLRDKFSKEGLDAFIAEKKGARQELEKTLRQIRSELNDARKKNDTEQIAKVKAKLQKVEDEFAEKLRKLFDKLPPKTNE